MKKTKKRSRGISRIFSTLSTYFPVSFWLVLFLFIAQLFAVADRKDIRRDWGTIVYNVFSNIRYWINDYIGYNLFMLGMLLLVIVVVRFEYKQYVKAKQELD